MENASMLFSGLLVILLLTSFVKMATVLSIVRYGLGLEGATFGLATLALALALSAVVVAPQLEPFGGLNGLITSKTDPVAIEKQFRPFLEKNTDPKVSAKLARPDMVIQSAEPKKQAPAKSDSFAVLVAGFLVSELKAAFLVGLIILIPFVVVDLLVTNAVAGLNINQIPASVISVPLKILLFFAVDGWTLVAEKLLLAYR